MTDDTSDKIHAACESAVLTNLSVRDFLRECEQGWLGAIDDQRKFALIDWEKAQEGV